MGGTALGGPGERPRRGCGGPVSRRGSWRSGTPLRPVVHHEIAGRHCAVVACASARAWLLGRPAALAAPAAGLLGPVGRPTSPTLVRSARAACSCGEALHLRSDQAPRADIASSSFELTDCSWPASCRRTVRSASSAAEWPPCTPGDRGLAGLGHQPPGHIGGLVDAPLRLGLAARPRSAPARGLASRRRVDMVMSKSSVGLRRRAADSASSCSAAAWPAPRPRRRERRASAMVRWCSASITVRRRCASRDHLLVAGRAARLRAARASALSRRRRRSALALDLRDLALGRTAAFAATRCSCLRRRWAARRAA